MVELVIQKHVAVSQLPAYTFLLKTVCYDTDFFSVIVADQHSLLSSLNLLAYLLLVLLL